MESIYKIKATSDLSFVVIHPKVGEIHATLDPMGTHWQVTYKEEKVGGPVPLFDFFRLCKHIAETVASQWERPVEHRIPGMGDYTGSPNQKFTKWLVKQSDWAITTRVRALWEHFVNTVPSPLVRDVQRKLFAASAGAGNFFPTYSPLFYKNEYLVRDVLTYRAAALAVLFCAPVLGIYEPQNKPAQMHAFLAGMVHWRSLLSPTGKSYKSLNVTLDNLPGGVNGKVVRDLSKVSLPRPMTDRITLLTYVYVGSMPLWGDREQRRVAVLAAIDRSSPEQMKRGWSRLAEHMQRNTPLKISWQRIQVMESLIPYLFDMDEDPGPTSTFVSVVDHAIEAHEFKREVEAQKVLEQYGSDKPLAVPPVALPKVNGKIHLLSTVGDLVNEGLTMRHCVASLNYAAQGIGGHSYFFHVEREGEAATVEVARYGVTQSYGEGNTANRASRYASRILKKWYTNELAPALGVSKYDYYTDVPF